MACENKGFPGFSSVLMVCDLAGLSPTYIIFLFTGKNLDTLNNERVKFLLKL